MSKPSQTEHDPYWSRYIDLVSEDDIVAAMQREAEATSKMLGGISEEKGSFRYAPDKWTIKDLVTHVADTERILNYRALSIARGDTRSLLGFEEKDFAANAETDRRTLRDIAAEWSAVRQATIAMFRGFSKAAWQRVGTANGGRISVNALAYVTVGHERHHKNVLREKYLDAASPR